MRRPGHFVAIVLAMLALVAGLGLVGGTTPDVDPNMDATVIGPAEQAPVMERASTVTPEALARPPAAGDWFSSRLLGFTAALSVVAAVMAAAVATLPHRSSRAPRPQPRRGRLLLRAPPHILHA